MSISPAASYFTRRVILIALVTVLALATVLFVPSPLFAEKTSHVSGPLLKRFLDGDTGGATDGATGGPMAGVEEIVFAVRVPGRDHWYVTFGNYADHSIDPAKRAFKKQDGVFWGYGDGARLCRMNLRTGEVKAILEDAKGGIRDPQMHYDGQKILFSYRKGGEHPFHLYEINIDGSGLRQLTDGPDDDIEPTYCPDGSIVFCSSRCRRFVNCWFTRVAALYRCDGDGKNIRMLSSNNDHDNTPWILPDGRVLYMRWEYVDRSQVHYHHLCTMNADGTGQMVYYGNLHGGIAMLDAKPVPGTQKVVAAYSPGHGRPEHMGPVSVIDPSKGPDELSSVRQVSKGSLWAGLWKDPYAISEDCFLVAHPRGIYVMDGQGNNELIYKLPKSEKHLQCHEPRPLRSRPRERIIPPRTDLEETSGQLVMENVYHGRKMAGVKKGTIKKLLVMQQLPKPVNFSGGMQPLTIGGSFTLAEILGTVPVEPDGSAYMKLPALRSIFFVALDEKDQPVKRMHSFLILQPGETTSCVGCHEQRVQAPPPQTTDLLAMRRPASRLKKIEGVPGVFDFPRDIQPILDKHCVKCHNADRREGRVDLSGDKTAMYTISYWTIRQRNLVNDARNLPKSNHEPYSYGSVASRLMKLIDGSHHDAKLSQHEQDMVRLWIESSATYPGTYASLGCGHYPVHLPFGEMRKHCGSCHGKEVAGPKGKKHRELRYYGGGSHHKQTTCNISRPEMSTVLRAPLAKEAGGMGVCKGPDRKGPIFKDKNNPLYQSILARIRDAHNRLGAGKRFDMPGFRPNKHYIREMQRFGFLPMDLKPDDPIDVYKVDRAYWDSFYFRPKVETAGK